jgi:hypothetical protein
MSEENVSLPVAQALASALEKIEAYVPTEYVDNSEPDIDAEHLNHAEQGIMRVTNLLNAAVDVIQGQESRLADAETKIGTAALTGGMTDLSSGLNALNSNFKSLNIPYTKLPNTYTEGLGGAVGWISNAGKDCVIYIPMIFKNNIASIKIAKILCSLRHSQGGYIGGAIETDLTQYIVEYSIIRAQGLFYIVLKNPDGWGITNNTPVIGVCKTTYTLS